MDFRICGHKISDMKAWLDWYRGNFSQIRWNVDKSKMNWINCDYIMPEQNLSPPMSSSCQEAFEIWLHLIYTYIPPENNSSYLIIHRKAGPVCPTFNLNFFKEITMNVHHFWPPTLYFSQMYSSLNHSRSILSCFMICWFVTPILQTAPFLVIHVTWN